VLRTPPPKPIFFVAPEIAPTPSPHPPLSTSRSCWGEKIEVTDEHASAGTLVGHFSLFHLPQKAAVSAKARVGRLWSANKDGAPELTGFMAPREARS